MSEDDELVNAAKSARSLQELIFQQERQNDRIAEIIKEAFAIGARVRALESYAQSRAIVEAREDERDKALYDRLARMEDHITDTKSEIKGIKGLGAKVLWTIASALILALVTFVLKGGLA
jgi:hypothetical protein